ncbi:cytoplasmic tRNA 2-thiolation protein 2 [Loxospora ochrophaea]|nr:cytoplasmic tRNA 2-thiolation protein 2 [Loxospora ochrophaea]
MTYVAGKVVKRIDGYKVRGASTAKRRKILLPVSLGVSSVTLLHILDQYLRVQFERTSRRGFEIHVLFVDESKQSDRSDALRLLQQTYPMHVYSTALLEDACDYLDELDDKTSPLSRLSSFPNSTSNTERLNNILHSLPSATSRSDIIHILRTRLITGFAKQNNSDSIAFGDSTTRLAEKTLSETAKGRGFSIPWQTSEGSSPHGVIHIFPLRDLLRKEILTYSTTTTPPLTPLITIPNAPPPTSISASSKDTSIDSLMAHYFESVEQNYPSIVANVVRTSSKLQAPRITPGSPPPPLCRICASPLESINHLDPQHSQGEEEEENPSTGKDDGSSTAIISNPQSRPTLCYGCARSINQTR